MISSPKLDQSLNEISSREMICFRKITIDPVLGKKSSVDTRWMPGVVISFSPRSEQPN
jgi:hypothetical protein